MPILAQRSGDGNPYDWDMATLGSLSDADAHSYGSTTNLMKLCN